MTLDHLWAAWRGEYIDQATERERVDAAHGVAAGAGEQCVFCAILASGAPDGDTNIVFRGTHVFVIMNAFPYTSGHVMVMPYRHVRSLGELTSPTVPTGSGESAELWATVVEATAVLQRAYNPEGINVGINLGRAAGAGIPGHLHVHLVPRWNGDTNFMTSVAGARVMPESLSHSGDRLRRAWESNDDRRTSS